MLIPMTRLRAHVVPAFVAGLFVLAAGCGGVAGTEAEGGTPAACDRGAIAYIDAEGCIAWVQLRTGAGGRHCPATRSRVTALTWLDARTIAFVTPELARTGWRGFDVVRGDAFALDPLESPRILQVGAPQYYSVRGERIDIEDGAATWTAADGVARRTLLAPGGGRGHFAMVTWAPDGEGVILAEGAAKALWVVDRTGANPRRIAPASAGFASWFVPGVGAMPHTDLTCTLPSEATYRCQPAPWRPLAGEPARPGETLVFAWTACPGATGYELELRGPGGELLHRDVSAGQTQRVAPAAPGAYTWQVRAIVGGVPGPWGEARQLSVADP